MSWPCSRLRVHAMCENTLSTESPMSCTPNSLKRSARCANPMNSVEQTGVKSYGWLKSTIHLPVYLPSEIGPCVEIASNSGAGELICGIPVVSDIASSLGAADSTVTAVSLRKRRFACFPGSALDGQPRADPAVGSAGDVEDAAAPLGDE